MPANHHSNLHQPPTHEGEPHRHTLTIAVSGSSGLIGSALVPFLEERGHRILRIVRTEPKQADEVHWDRDAMWIDAARLEGVDAVIHLAGENVLSMRWSEQKKMQIYASRVRGTQLLSRTLARLDRPPRVFLSASAIGYYGSRGAEVLTERSAPGSHGFLTAVCQDWENATADAADAGIRTVRMRIGVVLDPQGGALATMLLPFRLGLGGRYGAPDQYLSWIAYDDLLHAVDHLLQVDDLDGPVNLVAPQPVTMETFARTLGRVLSRPTLFDIPPFLFRLLYGNVAEETVLLSARVYPERLQRSGYAFRHPDLEDALRYLLGKSRASVSSP